MGLLDRLRAGLRRTRDALTGNLARLVRGRRIDEDLLEEIEEALIESDLGVRTTEIQIDLLRDAW